MKVWSFEFISLFLVSLVSFLIILPFLNAVILGAITAYILHPLIFGLKRVVRSYNLAVIITIFLIAASLFAFVTLVVRDATPVVSQISGLVDEVTKVLELLRPTLESFGLSESLTNTQEIISLLETYIMDQIMANLKSIPTILVNIVVYLFATYYFLKDGIRLKNAIVKYIRTLPYRDCRTGLSMIYGLKNSLEVLFFSYITMSVIMAVVAWVGFELLGIPYAWILAVLIGLTSFLPLIGMAWVYVPLAAYEYLIGNELLALYVLVFGVLVLNVVPDIFLRPYIGAKVGKVHPLTILLGFFGGPVLFGMMGFIIGPIILVIAETAIRSYVDLSIKMSSKESDEKQASS
ncbi:MAG: AI-2E family transporter [Candidatus Aenigmarchaeota archaeon]|nr:AI-2E family transporter [Candidatus Aenigmarchaeota archaeon]